jgi:hypothetical protein
LKGFDYIHYLLSNPNREFHVIELVHKINKTLPTEDIYNGVNKDETKQQLIEEGLTSSLSGATDDMMSNVAIKNCHDSLKELRRKLEDAIELNNEDEAVKLNVDIEEINMQLKKIRGRHGRTRKFADPAEKARKSVSKAYNDSLRKIKDDHPTLWKYLKKTITIGIYSSYKPENSILWNL